MSAPAPSKISRSEYLTNAIRRILKWDSPIYDGSAPKASNSEPKAGPSTSRPTSATPTGMGSNSKLLVKGILPNLADYTLEGGYNLAVVARTILRLRDDIKDQLIVLKTLLDDVENQLKGVQEMEQILCDMRPRLQIFMDLCTNNSRDYYGEVMRQWIWLKALIDTLNVFIRATKEIIEGETLTLERLNTFVVYRKTGCWDSELYFSVISDHQGLFNRFTNVSREIKSVAGLIVGNEKPLKKLLARIDRITTKNEWSKLIWRIFQVPKN